jgi:hypothetical protein
MDSRLLHRGARGASLAICSGQQFTAHVRESGGAHLMAIDARGFLIPANPPLRSLVRFRESGAVVRCVLAVSCLCVCAPPIVVRIHEGDAP